MKTMDFQSGNTLAGYSIADKALTNALELAKHIKLALAKQHPGYQPENYWAKQSWYVDGFDMERELALAGLKRLDGVKKFRLAGMYFNAKRGWVCIPTVILGVYSPKGKEFPEEIGVDGSVYHVQMEELCWYSDEDYDY